MVKRIEGIIDWTKWSWNDKKLKHKEELWYLYMNWVLKQKKSLSISNKISCDIWKLKEIEKRNEEKWTEIDGFWIVTC